MSLRSFAKKIRPLLIATGLLIPVVSSPLVNPTDVYAQSESRTITFDPSSSQNQSKTITIENLKSVNGISVNTGNVSYSVNGNKVTINVSNGNYVSREYDSKMYSKTATAYKESSVNSFASSISHSSDGYSGSLSKKGGSFVARGSYTAAKSKTVTEPQFRINRIDTHIWRTTSGWDYYSTDPHPSSEAKTKSYNSGGFKGTLTRSSKGTVEDRRVSYPRNPSNGTKHKYIYFHTNYVFSGTVTKPASDTRVYRQDYSGTIYKGGYKNYKYGYTVTLNVETNEKPTISGSVTNGNKFSEISGHNAINLDLDVKDTNSNDTLVVKYELDQKRGNLATGLNSGSGKNHNLTKSVTVDANVREGSRTLKVWVEDQYGEKSETLSFPITIDKTPPTGSTFQSSTSPTNANVVINITTSDDMSGVKTITLPNKTVLTATSTSYTVSENGTYRFVIADAAGNTTTVTTTVDNIDKKPPTLTLAASNTEWTNESITITAVASDEGGIEKIILPSGEVVSDSKASYTVSSNGEFTFIAYDNVGNTKAKSITISNYDDNIPNLKIDPISEKRDQVDVRMEYADE